MFRYIHTVRNHILEKKSGNKIANNSTYAYTYSQGTCIEPLQTHTRFGNKRSNLDRDCLQRKSLDKQLNHILYIDNRNHMKLVRCKCTERLPGKRKIRQIIPSLFKESTRQPKVSSNLLALKVFYIHDLN